MSTLPSLKSKQRPPVGKKAADSYMLSTHKTRTIHQYEKNTKPHKYSVGIYLSHFTISTAYHSPLSPQEQGFSSGLIYLHRISDLSHLFFRGHLSLEKFNNSWHISVIPSILYNLFPVYVGIGGPGLNFFLNVPNSNNFFAMDWQLLTGIRFFEIFNFFNFFIEARWKNPFNVFDTSQKRTIHFLTGILLLF